ncbi:flagellar hook-associated protein 2 [Priestia koreensis]|uniref:flagellar hook-associated protein 2 n=1 Tax=Priestia koreensis TaxID=284581 RepID=UPI003018D4F1
MVTRISGLASGMDIDQMVSDMMKAQKIPLDKMKQQKQWTEWQRDSYRDVNTKLNELLTMAKDMNYQKTYVSKKTTSSNEGAVSATASPSSSMGTYSIKVNQIATAAINTSQNKLSKSAAQKVDPNKTFGEQSGVFNKDVANGSFKLTTYGQDGAAKEVTIDVATTDTLNGVLKKINDSGAGIRAFYDSASDKVVMERTVTGNFNKNGSEIIFGSDTGSTTFLNSVLQLDETKETGGDNAKFVYNNALTVESTSNQYTINGIQLNLKNVTAGNETISVQTDTDATFDSIVKFVNKYNEIIESVNKKLDEKRYRDYAPLSDDQKKDMKDKDIELWEEKSKSGLLRGDSSLSSGLNTMRTDFYAPLAGALQGFAQLSDLGITTSSNYLDKGKLIINDESKLRSKIAENPDAIYKLFAENGDGKTKSTMGIADRLVQTITSTIGKVEEKAGKTSWTNQKFSLGRTLDTMNKQIDSFQDRLTQMETRYYSQFTAMEKAIQRANQQSAYITQQFSG